MNILALEPEYGETDEESPEWTEADFLWAVDEQDFPDHAASHAFLLRREVFLRAAASVGLSREGFLPFLPNKPGFVERAIGALDKVLEFARHAAE